MSAGTVSPTVAEYLTRTLPYFGVTHVFELTGGMITVLLDSLHTNPELAVISVRHEQAAGFAAEGFARMSGRPAVAMATSGPGATNLLTAVGSCYFDSIPVVFITGQVNQSERHTPGIGRQSGFQETDIVAMATPVTKWAVSLESAGDFPAVLEQAFQIARGGRPGPVLIDIPMNLQRQPIGDSLLSPGVAESQPGSPGAASPTSSFIEQLSLALAASSRPLILAGGGIRAAGASEALASTAMRLQVPVVTSLLGVDALSSSSPLRVGLVGSYGNRWANWALAQSDLLLVLGSRLDVRQTGSDIAGFKGERRIFHVDIDATELNNHVPGCEILNAELSAFLNELDGAEIPPVRDSQRWFDEIAAKRRLWPDDQENVSEIGLNPNEAMHTICSAWSDVSGYVTDVGQHQMWAAQSAQLHEGQRFLTSGGMGAMGFALPAALGAWLSRPNQPICVIAGDGGLQCNLQELQTLVQVGANVRIVVFDNRSLGMVRQFQAAYFDSRYHSSRWGYSAPDFRAIAGAFGIPAWTANDATTLDQALRAIRSEVQGPSMLCIAVDPDLNVYPKMAFGQPFGSMEPDVAPIEMEGT